MPPTAIGPAPPAPSIGGERFGRYQLIGKLGAGGMAEVHLACATGAAGFRKLVVLKRVHRHLEREEGFLPMFLDEARLAARLSHPAIVQTHEVGEVDGWWFLAMEHLDGQGLDRLRNAALKERDTFPGLLAVRIVSEVLDGLHYAHELTDFDGTPLGVIHRDVSPQNVFVTYDGVVKLLDFGVAKAATQLARTRTGVIKGKFAYIAPEQLEGRLDRRADVWAAGVVLWELIAGRRLFKAANEMALLAAVRSHLVPRLDVAAPGTPEPLVRAVARALARDPDQRYPTALAFKRDLDAFLASRPDAPGREELGAFARGLFADHIAAQRRLLEEVFSGARAPADLDLGVIPPQAVTLESHTTSLPSIPYAPAPPVAPPRRGGPLLVAVAVGGLVGALVLLLALTALSVFLALQGGALGGLPVP